MSVERDGDEVAYRSRRRWPGPSGARADLTVLDGEPVEIGPLEDFLTCGSLSRADAAGPSPPRASSTSRGRCARHRS
jgi:uncharacterized protein YqjF (DUF2071 family)